MVVYTLLVTPYLCWMPLALSLQLGAATMCHHHRACWTSTRRSRSAQLGALADPPPRTQNIPDRLLVLAWSKICRTDSCTANWSRSWRWPSGCDHHSSEQQQQLKGESIPDLRLRLSATRSSLAVATAAAAAAAAGMLGVQGSRMTQLNQPV